MLEDKIARAKSLFQRREELDAEINALFGGVEAPRRGRPRKDAAREDMEERGNANGGAAAESIIDQRAADAVATLEQNN